MPIPHRTIAVAKLRALILFGVGFAIAINLIPTVVYPGTLVAKLHVEPFNLLRMMAAHGVTTIGAGAFSFLTVMALRGTLLAALGHALFARVSAFVQGLLVVSLVSTLFLLPTLASNVSGRWLSVPSAARYALPPLWFVGAYEAAAGDVVVGARHVNFEPMAPRLSEMVATNQQATDIYRNHRDVFYRLAGTAALALAITTGIALVTYAWNMRRLPPPAETRQRRYGVGAALAAVCRATVARHPIVRAGFFFTLQALFRSAPHRLSMAAACAIGMAAAIIVAGGFELRYAALDATPARGLLAAQFLVLFALLLGFRHAMRVPAELRANWTFQLAWPGDVRRLLTGVRRAAILGLVVPVVVLMFPLHAAALGPRIALLHALCGLAAALTLLEALLVRFRTLPFACNYAPGGSLKMEGAGALFAFIVLTTAFVSAEQVALASARGTLWLLVAIATIGTVLRVTAVWQGRRDTPIQFESPPESAIESLGLSA